MTTKELIYMYTEIRIIILLPNVFIYLYFVTKITFYPPRFYGMETLYLNSCDTVQLRVEAGRKNYLKFLLFYKRKIKIRRLNDS